MAILWVILHLPAVHYGTANIPLHAAFIGDEQSPINGALHIIESNSLLGLRDLPTVYYGPVFSVIALPAVIFDYAAKLMTGAVHSAADYRNYIIWDWGGIDRKARLISVVTGFLALLSLYALLMTETINPKRSRWLALVGVSLLAFNFYFFEYSSYFKHWIYVIAALIAQIYFLVRMIEDPKHIRRYYIWQGFLFVATFGLSYVSALSQIIFLPVLIKWYRDKNYRMLKAFGIYCLCLIIPLLLMIIWHPRSFLRLIHVTGGDITGTGFGGWTQEALWSGFSFVYYLKIIVTNHLALLGLWLMLIFRAIRKRIHRSYIFWLPICVMGIFFLIFGLLGHHESRYILPVIVSIIMSAAMLLVMEWDSLNRMMRIVSIMLVSALLIYHGTSLYFWDNAMLAGPAERVAVATAVEYQRLHPQAKQLFVADYIFGYPHTRAAYDAYIGKYNKARYGLFDAMTTSPLPTNITLLNAYYIPIASFRPSDVKGYDRVLYRYMLSTAAHLEPDFPEVDLTRYWVSPAWSDDFIQIK